MIFPTYNYLFTWFIDLFNFGTLHPPYLPHLVNVSPKTKAADDNLHPSFFAQQKRIWFAK